MPNQFSIRLPVLVAAKVSALCEIFPKKSKSEIIGDVLAVGLELIEDELPSYEVAAVDRSRRVLLMEMAGNKLKYHESVKSFIERIRNDTNLKVSAYSYTKQREEDIPDDNDYEYL